MFLCQRAWPVWEARLMSSSSRPEAACCRVGDGASDIVQMGLEVLSSKVSSRLQTFHYGYIVLGR